MVNNENLLKVIAERVPETLEDLHHDLTSPQYRAFQWVRLNPPTADELEIYPLRSVQKYALAVFFYSTNGEYWAESDGWLTTEDECTWFFTGKGRICDSAGRIMNIELKNNNLNGDIPTELILLSDLKYFRVNGNSLKGTIPSKIFAQATNLEQFHAHWNSLSGVIPSNLSGLPKLQSLRVNKNKLVGTIPWQLSQLAEKLDTLDLSSNNLSGTIPFMLGDLSTLSDLNLSNNNLSGTIPVEFSNLSSLTNLELDSNNLVGTMPEGVCELPLFGSSNLPVVDCDEISCQCCEVCL